MDMDIIREFLKEKARAEGSQSALARKTGISQAGINKIIHGGSQKVAVETIQKLADAYQKDIAFFLVGESPQLPHEEIARTEKEKRILMLFRGLDEHRQNRFISLLEDMALAQTESGKRA